MKQPFADLELIRQRAVEDATDGAVTLAYHADRERVVEVLNELLATCLVVQLQCKHHYFTAKRAAREPLAESFACRAESSGRFADALAERIAQLHGIADYRPEVLPERSHVRFGPAEKVAAVLQEGLAAVRIQIETLCAVIRWLSNDDPTTRRVLEEGLQTAERFAHRLAGLLRLEKDQEEQRQAARRPEPTPEVILDTQDTAESERVSAQREQWLETPEKPQWWDPQWIARS